MHAAPSPDRHYGLDWLRIGAFALLIVYHVGMVFAPWNWVVKWPETVPALIAPMALLTPWRLPLLFVVSGFATRRLLMRRPDLAAFARGRTSRLLVPAIFAVLVLLPPEMWVRVRLAGSAQGFLHYWLGDYWSPSGYYGYAFPHWEHLWFVVYLWAYTMMLVALVSIFGVARIQAAFERFATGKRLAFWPLALLVIAKLSLMFVVPESQGLTRDWAGHASYFPLFLFGFALGGSAALWQAVRRTWRIGLVLALFTAPVLIWVELTWLGDDAPGHAIMAFDRAARLAFAWGVILLLLNFADTRLNRDHPLRRTLAEAVFPAYIIHHPVLVLLGWSAAGWGIGPGTGFLVLLTATGAACSAFYLIGRRLAWLRPLIGLAPTAQAPRRQLVRAA